MDHQHNLDNFFPEKVFESVEACKVYEATGTLRLKVSKKVWKAFNIPDKAVVRCRAFKSRYDTTAALRLPV
ncbi:MAG: hypothetical protein QXH32_01970 [Candidatus Caldarchaeum sp.]